MKRLATVVVAVLGTQAALYAQGLGASQLTLQNSSGGGVILQPDPSATTLQPLVITPPPSPGFQLVYTPSGWQQNRLVKWTSSSIPSLGNSLIYDDGTNIGIGTTAPAALLHVAGTGRFDGQLTVSSGGAAITGNVSVTGNITATGDLTVEGNTTLGNAASDNVTFTARVNSDILPSADATYDLGSSMRRWRSGYFGTSVVVGSSVSLVGATNELAYSGGDGLIRVVGANALQVWTNGAERLRVTAAGQVGIGTTAPAALLHVYDASASGVTQLIVQAGAGQAGAGTNLFEWRDELGNGLGAIDASGFVGIGLTTGIAGMLHVQSNGAQPAAVFEAGNVGIGTTAPAALLHVYDASASGVTQLIVQAGAGQAGAGTNLFEWRDELGNGLGAIDASGFVGIGLTTGIAGMLHVKSNTAQPAAVFEDGTVSIDNPSGYALEVADEGGGVKFSYGVVGVVANAATIPDNLTVVQVNSDNDGTNDNITLPTGAVNGQILYVRYVGTDNAVFTGVMPGGGNYTTTQSAHLTFVYIGGAWRLMSVVE